jgi:hypothetical protein
MSCTSCNDDNASLRYTDCDETPVTIGCLTQTDAQCVIYKGDTLSCLGVDAGTTLEGIIQLIDNKVCSISNPDFTAFNTYCVTAVGGGAVTNLQEFVEGVSNQHCALKTAFDTFTTSTFVDYQNGTTNIINGIKNPAIAGCTYTGVTALSTLTEVLTAHDTKLCDLNSKIALTGVNWDSCFTVTDPTTIAQGFNSVISMICSVKTDLAGVTGDTYKVKVSATDSNPEYLLDKFMSNCLTFTEYLDPLTSKKKVFITPTDKVKHYSFDTNQFDVNTTTTGTCKDDVFVTIKPSVLNPTPYTLTCTAVDTLYASIVAGTKPDYLYGNVGAACTKIDGCGVRRMIAEGFGDGNYVLKVETAHATACSKATWVAAPEVDCATVAALFDSSVSGTEPQSLYGTTSGGNCKNIEACGLRNWMFITNPGNVSGEYTIQIDTSATDPCDKVTLKSISPSNPCWNNTMNVFTPSASGSYTDGTYTTTNGSTPLWSGGPNVGGIGPVWQIDAYGNFSAQGILTVDIIPTDTTDRRSGSFNIPLGTGPATSCYDILTQAHVIPLNIWTKAGSSGAVGSDDMFLDWVQFFLVLDPTTSSAYLRVNYITSGPDTGILDAKVVFSGAHTKMNN